MGLGALRKLKGRSLEELRTRARQALSAARERGGLSPQSRLVEDAEFLRNELLGRFSSAESLLDHFRTRRSPHFFPAFREREAISALLQERWPEQACAVVEVAEAACAGCFELLGRRDLDFGDPIDWRCEPVSGAKSPLVHWSRIDHLDTEQVGEYKLTWELNRHQHFVALGQAYWYTSDDKYAATFSAHLSGWIDANPPKKGINWTSSLEVSLRAIAWIWALHLFRRSEHLTPALFLRVLKLLHLHGRHVETYLSTYFSPNTHLTGEALGLFHLGVLLPELRAAERWRKNGLRIMLEQLDVQVRPDGVYFEQASYYQRYTADFYTQLLILCRENGIALPGSVEERLQALLDHLMWITRPDGTTPLVGDDDGGRLVTLERRAPNDFRASLSTGAALFAREDYAWVAGDAAAETLWLLGMDGIDDFDALTPSAPTATSRAFSDGGYFVMRDGWSADSNYLLFDCGPHGTRNCGHAHADALSFDLAARGQSFLVDPGTFTYVYPLSLRNRFRSSTAHNTVAVEGRSSSIPDGPFQWESMAQCELESWIPGGRFDYVSGSHDGFSDLPSPARHQRSILFLKEDYWVIRDTVASRGDPAVAAHLQFASGVMLVERTDGVVAALGAPSPFVLDVSTAGNSGPFQCSDGWVSRAFGQRTVAPHCVIEVPGHERSELFTFLVSRAASDTSVRCRELPAGAGRAFLLEGRPVGSDLLLIANSAGARQGQVASDFGWSWLRKVEGKVREYVLIGGTRLKIDGRVVVRSKRMVGYFEAQLNDGVLHVETDTPDGLFIDPLGADEVVVNRSSPPNRPGGNRPCCTHAAVVTERTTSSRSG